MREMTAFLIDLPKPALGATGRHWRGCAATAALTILAACALLHSASFDVRERVELTLRLCPGDAERIAPFDARNGEWAFYFVTLLPGCPAAPQVGGTRLRVVDAEWDETIYGGPQKWPLTEANYLDGAYRVASRPGGEYVLTALPYTPEIERAAQCNARLGGFPFQRAFCAAFT